MITLAKIIGFFLLILVGYHYINKPLEFSIAGSVATAIFAICLTALYQTYNADKKNWLGWVLIAFGCLVLSSFSSFNLLLILPVLMIVTGYQLAELPFNWYSSGGDGGHSGSDSWGCDGGSGGDGGGD